MVDIKKENYNDQLETMIEIMGDEDFNKRPKEKLLMLGLDNSGKTSIVLSLKGGENLLSYYSLKPTKGIEINQMEEEDKNFYVWDFGGQKKFRKEYLKDFETKAKNAKKLIYVIDIQDFEKINDSMDYFRNIISFSTIKKMEILVFLHKFDPAIEVDPNHPVHNKIRELIPKIEEILQSHPRYKIFKTSIYTTFRKLEV